MALEWARWWVRIPDGFLVQQTRAKTESEGYHLIVFDGSGRELRRGIVRFGQGPSDMMAVNPFTLRLSADARSVAFVDNYDFSKELDLAELTVKTKFRLIDRIPGYGTKYLMGWSGIEAKDGRVVMSLESPAYRVDRKYFLAECDEEFRNFRIIAALRKSIPAWLDLQDQRTDQTVIVDYYDRLRWLQSFSVDWAREQVYCVPDIESAELERVSFDGRIETITLDLPEPFPISEQDFESFFRWHDLGVDSFLKSRVRFDYRKPKQAPPLMGVKVIRDWLLVITGHRDGGRRMNRVLVYRLPALEYEGDLWMPFPSAPELNLRWAGEEYYFYGQADDEERTPVFFYRCRIGDENRS